MQIVMFTKKIQVCYVVVKNEPRRDSFSNAKLEYTKGNTYYAKRDNFVIHIIAAIILHGNNSIIIPNLVNVTSMITAIRAKTRNTAHAILYTYSGCQIFVR